MRKKDLGNFEDDHRLWESVTSQVKPLKSIRYSAATEKTLMDRKSISFRNIAGRNAAVTIAKNPVPSVEVTPIDLREGEHAGLDRTTRRKLAKGNLQVDARIDLHGYNAQQAKAKLLAFIQQSAYYGHRCLLVITGKGLRGEGVLRRHVPIWLKQPPIDGIVLAISNASPKHGGTGAIYVMLRRTRKFK